MANRRPAPTQQNRLPVTGRRRASPPPTNATTHGRPRINTKQTRRARKNENARAAGHDGRPVQDAVPDQQILRGEGADAHAAHLQNHSRSVQGCAGRAEGGRSSGAAVHIVAHRVQWKVRGFGSHIAVGVRGRVVSESDGRFQFRRRRVAAGVCRFEIERRQEEVYVFVGRVHYGFWVFVGEEDQVEVPDVGGASLR